MKRALLLLVFLLALVSTSGLALASDISDALYYGDIQVSNNSTASTKIATTMALDSASLIDTYGVDTAFDYVAIRNTGGDDVPFMPSVNATNPWCLWAPTINANSSFNDVIYTGQTDLGATKYYFPGDAGMSIIDAASMEPGSNFKIEMAGYYNTSDAQNNVSASTTGSNGSGTNHIVTLPASSEGDLILIAISTYGLQAMTFPEGWTQLYQNSAPGIYPMAGAWYKVADGTEGANITVTTAGAVVTAYAGYCITGQIGNPEADIAPATGETANPDSPYFAPSWSNHDTLWIAIGAVADFTGFGGFSAYPSGYSGGITGVKDLGVDGVATAMAYKYNAVSAENPPSFTGITTHYWVANTVAVHVSTVIVHKNLALNIVAGDGNISATIYGGTTVTATVANGEHKLEVYADGTTLYIEVDDVVKDSAALGGVPVPNNANTWYVGSAATPYIEYFSEDVSGVNKCYIDWEYATVFHDSSGNSNDATPSFRTASSDADVSAQLVSFQPVTQASAEYSLGLDWPTMVTAVPDQPDTMYTENSTPGIFFAPLIHTIWPLSGVPESFFWYNFAFAIIIIAGILVYRINQSLLLKTIVTITIMIFWALPGVNVYGMYVVIYYGMFSAGLLILSKSYGW